MPGKMSPLQVAISAFGLALAVLVVLAFRNYVIGGLGLSSQIIPPASIQPTQKAGTTTGSSNQVLVPTYTPTPNATATSTPSATPSSTNTPTPTFTPFAMANANANLRSGPGTNYLIVGGLSEGNRIEPVAQTGDGQWLLLHDGSWIYSPLVNNLPGNLQITYDIPPTPKPLPTATPSPSPVPPIPKQVESPPNYKDLSRYIEQYVGRRFEFVGQVVQVVYDDYGTAWGYRINITPSFSYAGLTVFDDDVYVTNRIAVRLLEDDYVRFVGDVIGMQTYTTIFGQVRSIPAIEMVALSGLYD